MIGESRSDHRPYPQQVTEKTAAVEAERENNQILKGVNALMNVLKERNKLLEFVTNRGLLEDFQRFSD